MPIRKGNAMSDVTANSGRIENGEHVFPTRVYYDDTDAAGVVYYANFLRMAERARTEMLRLLGAEHGEAARVHGVALAVRRCEVDYMRPARLDDALHIHSRLVKVGGASMNIEQVVRRAGEDLVRLTLRIACVTRAGGAARLPDTLQSALQNFLTEQGATNMRRN
ncbi:MAG: YbgC/FadM family acyl-CoA thioesterase [Rhodospirillales bacterium]|nr:YbgC/FadM family acyl-CoA thioesterase [Rhodospirillales bacterium]